MDETLDDEAVDDEAVGDEGVAVVGPVSVMVDVVASGTRVLVVCVEVLETTADGGRVKRLLSETCETVDSFTTGR